MIKETHTQKGVEFFQTIFFAFNAIILGAKMIAGAALKICATDKRASYW